MIKLVGFTGKARSGKTTSADALVDLGFVRVSFASPVKAMVRQFLMFHGLSENDILWHEHHKDFMIQGLNVSIRELWQSLGTDWGRNLVSQDAWVGAADQVVGRYLADVCCESRPAGLVFDDVRFENEAAYIRAQGGTIIHLERDLPVRRASDIHASEAGIEKAPDDLVLANSADAAALVNKVKLWALR